MAASGVLRRGGEFLLSSGPSSRRLPPLCHELWGGAARDPIFLSAVARAPGEGRPSRLDSPERGGEAHTIVASDGGEGLGDIALEVAERLLEGVVRIIKAEDHVKEVVVADVGGECGLRLREVEEVAETLWSASTCVTP